MKIFYLTSLILLSCNSSNNPETDQSSISTDSIMGERNKLKSNHSEITLWNQIKIEGHGDIKSLPAVPECNLLVVDSIITYRVGSKILYVDTLIEQPKMGTHWNRFYLKNHNWIGFLLGSDTALIDNHHSEGNMEYFVRTGNH